LHGFKSFSNWFIETTLRNPYFQMSIQRIDVNTQRGGGGG
jgi:hypothetical protein